MAYEGLERYVEQRGVRNAQVYPQQCRVLPVDERDARCDGAAMSAASVWAPSPWLGADAGLTAAVRVLVVDLDRIAVNPAVLALDEAAGVARLATPALRRRQAAAHAWLREVLGAVLGVAPAMVPLARAPGRKPSLQAAVRLEFNLSHSGPFAMLALAEAPVGIDVEAESGFVRADGLPDWLLSETEHAASRSAPASQQARLLCEAWTRKEALLKATGEGIGEARAGTIDLAGPSPAGRWTAHRGGRAWELAALPAPAGYAAALCHPQPLPEIVIRQWADAGWVGTAAD